VQAHWFLRPNHLFPRNYGQGMRRFSTGSTGAHMLRRWDVLVVCAEMGNRGALIRMLEGMSVGVFSCSTLSQAMEVLTSRKIELVFCDEKLSDGTFRDLLLAKQICIGRPHFVVIGHSGESAEYAGALEVEPFEVISYPLQPTDVEFTVIRAMRDGVQESFFQVSA
jgi:DNA-binding NtrC family response regulator